jgi:hypothetical protein
MTGVPYNRTLKFAPDTLDRIRVLWEQRPELSASRIGERFGMTKNAVIGQAHRRGWNPRRVKKGPEPSTTIQRLDAINAKMDKLLAETRKHVEERQKLIIADKDLLGLAA